MTPSILPIFLMSRRDQTETISQNIMNSPTFLVYLASALNTARAGLARFTYSQLLHFISVP